MVTEEAIKRQHLLTRYTPQAQKGILKIHFATAYFTFYRLLGGHILSSRCQHGKG